MANKWDITFAAGQDQAFTWDYQSTPVDITGWNLQLAVRQRFDKPVLFTLTVGNGLILTNPTQGKMLILFPSALTKDLPPARYVYDIWRMDTGQTEQLTYGYLNLTERAVALP